MTNEERQTVIQALEAVDALIDHQFTGTSKGMTALQHACDDCREALAIMLKDDVPETDFGDITQQKAFLEWVARGRKR